MRERPILMSAPMVRAILAGTKTQTRRVLRQQPQEDVGAMQAGYYHPTVVDRHGEEQPGPQVFGAYSACGDFGLPCPFGQPGDRLWVRETFAKVDGQTQPWIETDYRATYKHGDRFGDILGFKKRWTPAIHMPRAASRITLEITGVRVERLQEISAEDAYDEGAAEWAAETQRDGNKWPNVVRAYTGLWESIHGPGSWAANPWVWVIAFRRLAHG